MDGYVEHTPKELAAAERKMMLMRRRLKQHRWGEFMNVTKPFSEADIGKYIPAGTRRNIDAFVKECLDYA